MKILCKAQVVISFKNTGDSNSSKGNEKKKKRETKRDDEKLIKLIQLNKK